MTYLFSPSRPGAHLPRDPGQLHLEEATHSARDIPPTPPVPVEHGQDALSGSLFCKKRVLVLWFPPALRPTDATPDREGRLAPEEARARQIDVRSLQWRRKVPGHVSAARL